MDPLSLLLVCLFLVRALAFNFDALRFVDRLLDLSFGKICIFRSTVSCDEYGVDDLLVDVVGVGSVSMSFSLS